MKLLSLNNIYKVYGEKIALNEITLGFEEGKVYGIIGENGAGKTTLLKVMANLTPIEGGERYYNGENIAFTDYEHLKEFSSIIENSGFYDKLSLYDNLKLHCDYMGYYNYDEIDNLLKEFNLIEYKNKKVKVLSLGQRQKLAIIRSIITKPKVLILDEPINGLEPIAIQKFRDNILALKNRIGTTTIIASHLLGELECFVDHIIVMKSGEVIKDIAINKLMEEINRYIDIKVDNLKLASVIIEEKLGITDFRVIGETKIRIYDENADIKQISKELVLNNILINEIINNRETLGEYITSLINGGVSCD